MALDGITLPKDPAGWHLQARNEFGVNDPSSLDISSIGASASKICYRDWLLLRVVWNVSRTELTHEALFGQKAGSEQQGRSRQLLMKESDWWKAFVNNEIKPWGWGTMFGWKLSVNNIRAREHAIQELEFSPKSIYDDNDPFRLVVEPTTSRLRQTGPVQYRDHSSSGSDGRASSQGASESSREDIRSHPASQDEQGSLQGRVPSNAPSSTGSGGLGSSLISKHRPDETLINMSLILLLQGLTAVLHQTGALEGKYNWSVLHRNFSVTQPAEPTRTGQPQKKTILTAKTDGCLQLVTSTGKPDDNIVLSIIEVKPFRRETSRISMNAIRIQEGAEMAAWISTDSSKGNLPHAKDGVYRYAFA